VFSAEEIAAIRATVAWLPGLARQELAATLCEHLDWYTLTGTPKLDACGELLVRLEAAGSLAALGPVHLDVVETPEAAVQWDAAVARWHPLGFKGAFGYRLRYFITAGEQYLGCVLLAGAARALLVRDQWIGWDAEARRDNRARILNNSRFLIFPHVRVPHLASHVLGQLARRVRADWLQHWGFEPLLLETFVDPRYYAGTCYRAAGWELLGETSGRGLARPARPIAAPRARCGSSP
jgi:hypothetical protein